MLDIDPLLLLCGGASSRMGSPKGLLDFHGRPWILEQLDRFASANGRHAGVVLGDDWQRYALTLGAQAWMPTQIRCSQLAVYLEHNPTPAFGPFSSVQIGCAALMRHVPHLRGVFILPIDVPVPRAAWRTMTEAARRSCSSVLALSPTFQHKKGHPVWVARKLLLHLCNLPPRDPAARLDVQLHQLSTSQHRRIAVNAPEIGLNINSPQDWRDYIKHNR